MKKFYDGKNVYEKVLLNQNTINRETKFQNAITRLSSSIFPHHFFSKWSPIINFKDPDNGKIIPGCQRKPDMLLVDKNYKNWIVVEVETVLDKVNHVRGQLQTFKNGDYGLHYYNQIKNPLKRNYPSLNVSNIRNMLINNPFPEVLCIIDEENDDYIKLCNELDVNMMILNIFSTKSDNKLYLSELTRPQILDYEKEIYNLNGDKKVHQDQKGSIKMYLNDENKFDLEKNVEYIKITKDKSLKSLKINEPREGQFTKNEFFQIQIDENGIYIELFNSPRLHSLGLDNFSIMRLDKENNFLLKYAK